MMVMVRFILTILPDLTLAWEAVN